MGRVIAQVVIPGPSAQPTDVFVNTWQFEALVGGLPSSAVVDIAEALDAFYAPLAAYYPSDLLDPVYKMYDADESMPRTPQEIAAAWTPTGAGDPLPREVAVTLSFYSVKNTPSQRGRLYLGPLTQGSVQTDARPQVSTGLRTLMVSSAQALVTELRSNSVEDIKWVVYSPTNGTVNAVTDVWVDNAHDTIRSRGIEPSERVTGLIDQT